MTEWTPGPWMAFRGRRMKRWDVGTEIVSYVARQVETEADARLIAAAPRLAKLLIYIEDQGYEPPETAAEIRTLLSEIGVEFDVSA